MAGGGPCRGENDRVLEAGNRSGVFRKPADYDGIMAHDQARLCRRIRGERLASHTYGYSLHKASAAGRSIGPGRVPGTTFLLVTWPASKGMG